MPDKDITVKGFECSKCKHQWIDRKGARKHDTARPGLCPKCKTPYWDMEVKK